MQRTSPRPGLTTDSRHDGGPHRIVIVGGGAGGLELATRLGNTLGRRGRALVTLIDRRRTHLWKPLLHEVAAGSRDLDRHEIDYLAQAHRHRFCFRLGDLQGLDRERHVVRIGPSRDVDGVQLTPGGEIAYDTLVVAIGSLTSDFGIPGVHEHAIPLETPDEARRFHTRLVDACLRAQAQEGPLRPEQLDVAIIGAGATGTELAAELHGTMRELVGYGLDRIDPDRDICIRLIEAAPRVLPALPERLGKAAQELLNRLDIETRTNARVSAVEAGAVVLATGERIPAEHILWTAGIKAPDVLRKLGLATNRAGQLSVRPTLQTTLDDDVFAIGDCADCPWPGHPEPVPARAQAAHQQASHMVGQIGRRIAGRPLRDWTYRDFGSLLSFGRHQAIGTLMGVLAGGSLFIEGTLAWLVYRGLHADHERALHGTGKVVRDSLARLLTRGTEPVVKLH